MTGATGVVDLKFLNGLEFSLDDVMAKKATARKGCVWAGAQNATESIRSYRDNMLRLDI